MYRRICFHSLVGKLLSWTTNMKAWVSAFISEHPSYYAFASRSTLAFWLRGICCQNKGFWHDRSSGRFGSIIFTICLIRFACFVVTLSGSSYILDLIANTLENSQVFERIECDNLLLLCLHTSRNSQPSVLDKELLMAILEVILHTSISVI